ncbi:MAG: CDP-alcohol phosphatidyltransferase family protein [Candidatus Marinimicrobia bacterium]|nr:CDP-alcohol phosphatidyltransferase family protein [Candidatus Neomarinimicrobiota bacterium]
MMSRYKLFADILTFFRIVIAFAIVIVGLLVGRNGITVALVLLLLGWLTDAFDGPLARRDPKCTRTWIGENDLIADVLLSLSIIIYFVLSGIISPSVFFFYFIFLSVSTLVIKSRSFYVTFIGLSYGLSILISYYQSTMITWLFLFYIIIIPLLTWGHFYEGTKLFFTGFKEIELRAPLKRWFV